MIKAHNPHTGQWTIIAATPSYISSVWRERREGNDRRGVRGGIPAVERRNAAYRRPRAVDDEWHGRLFHLAETGMLHRRHETAALHMLVAGKSQWSIDRHTRNALGLHQLRDLGRRV